MCVLIFKAFIYSRDCVSCICCVCIPSIFLSLSHCQQVERGGGGSGGDFIAVAETATTGFPHHPPPFMSHLKK